MKMERGFGRYGLRSLPLCGGRSILNINTLKEVLYMLSLIGAIVVIGWLLSFLFHVGGSFVHLLLVVAGVLFIVDFFMKGRR